VRGHLAGDVVSIMDDQARTPPSISSRSHWTLTHRQAKSCARPAVTCGRVDAGDSDIGRVVIAAVGVEEPSMSRLHQPGGFETLWCFWGLVSPIDDTTGEPTMPENSDRGARRR
jgi:hypothetical protein